MLIFHYQIILEEDSLVSCVTIMDKIAESLSTLYLEAGRGDKFIVMGIHSNRSHCVLGKEYGIYAICAAVGGEKLTGYHQDSAKGPCAGVHNPVEQFTHLSHVMEEIFHIQQDLLEVCRIS